MEREGNEKEKGGKRAKNQTQTKRKVHANVCRGAQSKIATAAGYKIGREDIESNVRVELLTKDETTARQATTEQIDQPNKRKK